MDHVADIEVSDDIGPGITATSTVLTVPVLHAQDVDHEGLPDDAEAPEAEVQVVVVDAPLNGETDFDCILECSSGQLEVGDAEAHRVLTVPGVRLRVQVRLEPKEHAGRVLLAVTPAA